MPAIEKKTVSVALQVPVNIVDICVKFGCNIEDLAAAGFALMVSAFEHDCELVGVITGADNPMGADVVAAKYDIHQLGTYFDADQAGIKQTQSE